MLLVVLPHLFGLAVMSPDDWPMAASVAIVRVSATLAALTAACVLLCQWWITLNQSAAWLGAAALALAIMQLPSALLELNDATAAAIYTPDTVIDSALALGFVALLALGTTSRTFRRREAPFLLGTIVGLTFGTLRLVFTTTGAEDALSTTTAPIWVAATGAAIFGGLVVITLRRYQALPVWARSELMVAAVTVCVGRTARVEGDRGYSLWDLAANTVMLGGFLIFAFTAAELLRQAMRDKERQLERTLARAESAERAHRSDEETFHELRSAIAGVGSASRILAGMSEALSPDQRQHLSELMSVEMARMERLLTGEREAPAMVALDPLISSLGETFGYLGMPIEAAPSGVTAWTVASDLNDALHVVLSNATRHAPGSTATISVRALPTRVEVLVADDGPGIPAPLRHRVFERGVKNGSGGKGLGLFIARELLERNGASIELVDSPKQGAAFRIDLPLKEHA